MAKPLELSLGAILWVAAGALFVAIRLAGVLSIPVGGVELAHLAGAWQANVGNDDGRFVPTMFQGLTAWSFEFTRSEEPMRWLAFIASATVPLSLYRVRGLFTEAGALLALVLLAFDPVSILLGSAAWAGAFDITVILWILVLTQRETVERYDLGLAAFVATIAGPLVLPFVGAIAAVRLVRQEYPSREQLIPAAIGVVAGILFASIGFGFGWEGITIPPLQAFIDGFEAEWSTETTGYLAVLYSAPILLAGVAAAVHRAYANWRDQEWPLADITLLAWGAIALAWVVAAGPSNDPTPLAAAALPFAIIVGRELPQVFAELSRVEWRYAGWGLAALLAAAFVTEAFVVDWARVDRPGGNGDKLIVAGLLVAVLACVGLLASNRRTAAALFVPVGVLLALPMLSGASNVTFGGPNEPLPSPITTIQGAELRDIALQAREERGGLIVIHSNFREEMTWPFRDSGDIVLATSVGADATIVIWPASEPAPEGFSVLDGQWGFLEIRHAPDGGFLDYLRWLSNRNSLRNTFVPVAVYQRTTE